MPLDNLGLVACMGALVGYLAFMLAVGAMVDRLRAVLASKGEPQPPVPPTPPDPTDPTDPTPPGKGARLRVLPAPDPAIFDRSRYDQDIARRLAQFADYQRKRDARQQRGQGDNALGGAA